MDDFPHVKRWFAAIAAKPSTIRAYGNARDGYARMENLSDEEREVSFGQSSAPTK